jgi:hypothetical protein
MICSIRKLIIYTILLAIVVIVLLSTLRIHAIEIYITITSWCTGLYLGGKIPAIARWFASRKNENDDDDTGYYE